MKLAKKRENNFIYILLFHETHHNSMHFVLCMIYFLGLLHVVISDASPQIEPTFKASSSSGANLDLVQWLGIISAVFVVLTLLMMIGICVVCKTRRPISSHRVI